MTGSPIELSWTAKKRQELLISIVIGVIKTTFLSNQPSKFKIYIFWLYNFWLYNVPGAPVDWILHRVGRANAAQTSHHFVTT